VLTVGVLILEILLGNNLPHHKLDQTFWPQIQGNEQQRQPLTKFLMKELGQGQEEQPTLAHRDSTVALTKRDSSVAFNNARNPTGPRPSAVPSSNVDGPKTNQPTRQQMRARRISKVFIEKEKKSDYWQEIITEVNTQGVFSSDDINNFINRAIALEVVNNFKDRELMGSSGPSAKELVEKVSSAMYTQIVELNNGRGVNVSGTGLEKIKLMERFLQAMEAKKEKEAELEAQKVQEKAHINSYAGYLLRVKPEVANEGGVAAGFAVLSSPRLIK